MTANNSCFASFLLQLCGSLSLQWGNNIVRFPHHQLQLTGCLHSPRAQPAQLTIQRLPIAHRCMFSMSSFRYRLLHFFQCTLLIGLVFKLQSRMSRGAPFGKQSALTVLTRYISLHDQCVNHNSQLQYFGNRALQQSTSLVLVPIYVFAQLTSDISL